MKKVKEKKLKKAVKIIKVPRKKRDDILEQILPQSDEDRRRLEEKIDQMKYVVVNIKKIKTEKCPNGHKQCMSAECWLLETKKKK